MNRKKPKRNLWPISLTLLGGIIVLFLWLLAGAINNSSVGSKKLSGLAQAETKNQTAQPEIDRHGVKHLETALFALG